MNKKSRGASILNLVMSIIGIGVVGYFSYIFSVLLSIAYKQADTAGQQIEVLLTIIALCLPAFMCFVNAVMSCVSFKYLGRGETKYSRGFHIAMIVVEFVAIALFIVYGIINRSSFIFVLIAVVYVIVYTICAILHIKDLKKSKSSNMISQDTEAEQI